MSDETGSLRVLLLGGFEVWQKGRQLRGFESVKVRALLAYLALNRGRSFSREHLSGLLWPESDDAAARQNLRQALYNLRTALGAHGDCLETGQGAVCLRASRSCWVDVAAFVEATGEQPHARASHALVRGVQLYRGELLAGVYLKDTPEFEVWLLAEQERLRGLAVGALDTLVGRYMNRGEFRMGIQYARRLVAMDPLSEEGHRRLLRLYGLAGERARALSHYRELRALLERELGVDPLPETTALYQEILADTLARSVSDSADDVVRPVVPLVGRDDAFAELDACWSSVLDGRGLLTLVGGEPGVGKSRLVRSFLDNVTSRRRCRVLQARAADQFPQPPYGVIADAARPLLAGDAELTRRWLEDLPAEALRCLRTVVPELSSLVPGLHDQPAPGPCDPSAVAAAVAAVLQRIGSAGPDPRPVVLFLDDVHWADHGTLEVLAALPASLADRAVWVVATADHRAGGTPLARLGRALPDDPGGIVRVDLDRLSDDSVLDISRALVGEHACGSFAEFLLARSKGLPLAVVALVNVLWDEGLLRKGDAALDQPRWLLAPEKEWRTDWPDDLAGLIRLRLQRLPSSTRRLASLAAVVGSGFDAETLCRAEHEHRAVVEVGLEILLERWFIRQTGLPWSSDGLESGMGLWSMGARDGRYDFDHDLIRRAVYEWLNPLRRGALHDQVARALDARGGVHAVEMVAYHALEAGDLELACPALMATAADAAARSAGGLAAQCAEMVRDLARKAREQVPEDRVEGWDDMMARASSLLERLESGPSASS